MFAAATYSTCEWPTFLLSCTLGCLDQSPRKPSPASLERHTSASHTGRHTPTSFVFARKVRLRLRSILHRARRASPSNATMKPSSRATSCACGHIKMKIGTRSFVLLACKQSPHPSLLGRSLHLTGRSVIFAKNACKLVAQILPPPVPGFTSCHSTRADPSRQPRQMRHCLIAVPP